MDILFMGQLGAWMKWYPHEVPPFQASGSLDNLLKDNVSAAVPCIAYANPTHLMIDALIYGTPSTIFTSPQDVMSTTGRRRAADALLLVLLLPFSPSLIFHIHRPFQWECMAMQMKD